MPRLFGWIAFLNQSNGGQAAAGKKIYTFGDTRYTG